MWKCASRTIKATFHQGIVKRSNGLSTKAPVDKNVCPFSKLAPVVVQHINNCYESCKSSCCIFTKYKENRGGFRRRNSLLGLFDNNIFDVLLCSGLIAAVKFCLIDPLSRKIFQQVCGPVEGCRNATSNWSLQFLMHKFYSVPCNFVLPENRANKDRIVEQEICTDSLLENLKAEEGDFNEIKRAHEKVLGILNNWKGTECVESGNYSEGVQYFIEAIQYNNVTALFNLGICHERGMGTSQNITRAAELYRKAADLGHATAMYNLGVLCARGSGNLNVDLNKARQLFKAAAGLGQRDAINALNLEKEWLGQLPEDIIAVKDTTPENKEEERIIESICNGLFSKSAEDYDQCLVGVKRESCDSLNFTQSKEMENSTLDNDSGILDLSPHNESDVVLFV